MRALSGCGCRVACPPILRLRTGGLALWSVALAFALAGCGSTTPPLPSAPGGVYSNTQYHFSVTYPSGWAANEVQAPLGSPEASSTATPTIPLTVEITQTGADTADTALLSSFTVTVLNAADPAIASSIKQQQAQASSPTPTLQTITLAGQQAYASTPEAKPLPNSSLSATHTDYYLLHGAYEYQLSTDAVSIQGADAALQSMLHSFTFTS